MNKIMIGFLLAFAASAAHGAAITVKEGDVVNKVREITLQEVSLHSGQAVILADTRGISLYTFDLDKTNQSNCRGGCLKEWPTLTVAADETLPLPFGKIIGNDGRAQLTLNGAPLYFYDDDKKPGDVFGEYPKWHPVVVTK